MKKPLALTGLSFLLVSCSSQAPKYTGETIIIKEQPQADIKELKLDAITRPQPPFSLEGQNRTLIRDIELSGYMKTFSLTHQKIYEELASTILNKGARYIPSSDLSVEDAKKMVRIVYVDEPLTYAMSNKYTIVKDDKNLVKEIRFGYIEGLDEDTISKRLDSLAGNIGEGSEITISESAFKELVEKEYKSFADVENITSDDTKKIINKETYNTILPFAFDYGTSELSYAKGFSYMLKRYGMESMIIAGERTRNTNAVGVNKFSGYKEDAKPNGNNIEITMDFSGVNFWNIYKIENTWYHADKTLAASAVKQMETDRIFGMGMSDEQSSLSKLTHHNESILGVYPMSYDSMALTHRKSADMFLEYSSPSNMVDDIAKLLAEQDVSSNLIVSFAEPSNFDYFTLSHKVIFDKLYEQGLINFSKYDIIIIPELLTVKLENIR